MREVYSPNIALEHLSLGDKRLIDKEAILITKTNLRSEIWAIVTTLHYVKNKIKLIAYSSDGI